MIATAQIPPKLLQLAALQDHVLSTEQVTGHGVSRFVVARLLRDGRWSRLALGIYLTVPVEPSWRALAWGGVLAGGAGARLGPEASGHLHDLVATPPLPVDVLVPATRTVSRDGPWVFVRERSTARSQRSVGAPPRLDVPATVVDLAVTRSEGEVVGLVASAVQKRRVSPDRVLRELQARRFHRHRRLLGELLGDVASGAESALEVRYLRDVERAHGLPPGSRQRSRFGLPYCSDVGYPDCLVLVELDGRLGHSGEDRFRDMWRDNEFALYEALTLRYGWFDVVDRPCRVAWQVATVLSRRGWAGSPTRCPRCRQVPRQDFMIA